jgi:hypothetical protein
VISGNVPIQNEIVDKCRLIRLPSHHRTISRLDDESESALCAGLNGRVFQQYRRIAVVTKQIRLRNDFWSLHA